MAGVAAIARWCADRIALDSSAGRGHGIASCSVKPDFDLINSSHADHAWGETHGLYFGRSRRR